MRQLFGALLRSRWAWLAAAVLALWLAFAGPYALTWWRLSSARVEIAAYRPERAAPLLSRVVASWPGHGESRLLSCRAAWQSGELDAAYDHLRAARRLYPESSFAVAFEWSLLQAAAGNTGEVEEYLQRQAARDESAAPLVREALAAGYVRGFRALDAVAVLDTWLDAEPGNVRAHSLRGHAYRLGRSVPRAADDFRKAVEADPARDDDRDQLAQCLLDIGGYEEALRHVAVLEKSRPGDSGLLVRKARCLNMLGKPDEARTILDGVLATDADNVPALRTLGQICLMDRNPADAEALLRRAVGAAPGDYQANWFLFQAMQQQPGREAETKAQMKTAEDIKDRLERLGELRARKMSENPLDPAVHYELGSLYLKTGRADLAERWLLGALRLDANHKPSHRALAELYEGRGEKEKAEGHRRAGR